MAAPLPFLPNLADRLDYAVAVSGMSARSLCLAAGLSHGYIGATKTRLKNGPVSIGSDEARALAKAAGLPMAWLTNNEGAADPTAAPVPATTTESPDRYPSRRAALLTLRTAGVDEAIIKIVAEMAHKSPGDPGMLYWVGEAVEEAKQALRVASGNSKVHARAPVGDDPFGPPRTTKKRR